MGTAVRALQQPATSERASISESQKRGQRIKEEMKLR